MPYSASIGTHLPCWEDPPHHVPGDDEDGITFDVEEQAPGAPIVVTPFGLYDCAPTGDGAAALVPAAEDVADRFRNRPASILGAGVGQESVMHQHRADMTTFRATTFAAARAF